jgi:hypothetical protein
VVNAMTQIIGLIRRTKDWNERKEPSGIYLSFWKADLIASVWNELFNISFADFRTMLTKLQQENFKDVPFDRIINSYEYDNDKGLLVPTDDDDWFHPNLVHILRSHKDKKMIYWNFIEYSEGAVTVHHKPFVGLDFVYQSNNYALQEPEDKDCLLNHAYIDRLHRHEGYYVDAMLSMHNRSLASLSLLRKRLGNLRNELIDLYWLYRQPVKVTGCVPEYLMRQVDTMLNIYRNKLILKKIYL